MVMYKDAAGYYTSKLAMNLTFHMLLLKVINIPILPVLTHRIFIIYLNTCIV